MTSTIKLLVTFVILAIGTEQTVRAQNPWSHASTGPAGSSLQGASISAATTQDGENPVRQASMRVSDQEDDYPTPAVSCDCGARYSGGSCDSGCASSGCDSRIARRCGDRCTCIQCRDFGFSQSFGSVEYMNWYNKGISLPPLVTTSPVGTPQGAAGVFGLPTTTVLFGNQDIDSNRQSGARLTIGHWFDEERNLAIVGKFYGVEGGAVNYTATSAGTPILGRPFFNANPIVNAEDALLVAFPGVTAGSVSAIAENDVLGAEVFGRSLLDMGSNYRLDLIGGYQFNRIDSDLAMTSTHTAGIATFNFNDQFKVDNQFHAGTLGLYGESYRSCWTLSALGKIALGNMHQVVDIQGNNTVTAGGAVTTNGGLYAQPTNIGNYSRDVMVWAPEANFKLNCAVTQRLSVSVGYSFLYFTRVSFAGDQIDRAVNATQLNGGAIVGPARPAFAFRDTDFWVQSVDLGLSWNY